MTSTRHDTNRLPETYSIERVSFGMTDNKGRQIGYSLAAYEAEIVAAGEYSHRPSAGAFEIGARVVLARFQPTRNGGGYGASQTEQLFATIGEARAAFAVAVAKSRKAYARKFPQA